MKAIIGVALLAVCVFGQTFDQLPIKTVELMKNQQMMTNPLLMTETTGMKTLLNGEFDQILTIQELIQHPLFQVYYQIPLFRQHFSHPLFQVYLCTPQFQNYWTHPVFPTFFQNTVLFYKYIYPQVFNNNFQTPMVNPVSWMNKMWPTTSNVFPTNYDQVIRKFIGVEDVQKNMNVQGLYWDKIMKNTFMNINKPEEITEIKTEVKIPTMVNPINKILNDKMVEESPMEMMMKEALMKDTLVKDSMVKDDLIKESLLKKFYLEKMMNKNFNKMTPEEFLLLQNKMQELIPTRTRRHANYVQIPQNYNYNTYNTAKALPYYYPTNQQVYYTQPQTTYTNTVGTPYTYTNTVGTPYTYTNTVGTYNTPYYYYPTQTVV